MKNKYDVVGVVGEGDMELYLNVKIGKQANLLPLKNLKKLKMSQYKRQ